MNKDINAIGIVRQMVADGQISQEVAEKYFPELAKSEDERIKNAVIDAIETLSDSPLKVKMLAWVEKRGEQKEDNPPFNDPKYLEGFDTGREVQKIFDEQKLADKVEPIEGEFPYNNPTDTLEGEIDNIWRKLSCNNRFSATKEGFEEVIRHFINFVGQNHTWSEEDEKMRALTIHYIREYQLSDRCRTTADEDMETSDACEEWLKFLKDRYTWKPSKKQIMNF